MSYSFTDPDDEDDQEDKIVFSDGEKQKDPMRFMLPVGDLLNHSWDNNARIEFE